MEITGRLTQDAQRAALKDGREVVNFSIAINDRFKSKGSNEVTNIVTYVACAYWINPGVAAFLKKGSVVELFGRIGVNVWKNMDGEPKGGLTMHVQQLKIFNGTRKEGEQTETPNSSTADDVKEDLPF
ncbi:single-stranded DNA-binding protein [Pinibacter soli]|uniref:Single-stranded DNA-binding protein n=1 Tax=Pinibacter soli TaxID=3044211 RepID=A0ABT6RFQ5_9BACT|nr:single-stranded DNA-binding protein [Pinibacter soli]MDI3321399.1 single-stranded DNA-binding protein [Pinibacter soli]